MRPWRGVDREIPLGGVSWDSRELEERKGRRSHSSLENLENGQPKMKRERKIGEREMHKKLTPQALP